MRLQSLFGYHWMFRQGGGARFGEPHEPDAEENSNRRRSDDPERNEMK